VLCGVLCTRYDGVRRWRSYGSGPRECPLAEVQMVEGTGPRLCRFLDMDFRELHTSRHLGG
jgi:hypothetical protein